MTTSYNIQQKLESSLSPMYFHGGLFHIFPNKNDSLFVNLLLYRLQICETAEKWFTENDINSGWVAFGYSLVKSKFGLCRQTITKTIANLVSHNVISQRDEKVDRFSEHAYRIDLPVLVSMLQAKGVGLCDILISNKIGTGLKDNRLTWAMIFEKYPQGTLVQTARKEKAEPETKQEAKPKYADEYLQDLRNRTNLNITLPVMERQLGIFLSRHNLGLVVFDDLTEGQRVILGDWFVTCKEANLVTTLPERTLASWESEAIA